MLDQPLTTIPSLPAGVAPMSGNQSYSYSINQNMNPLMTQGQASSYPQNMPQSLPQSLPQSIPQGMPQGIQQGMQQGMQQSMQQPLAQGMQSNSSFIYLDGMAPVQQSNLPQNSGMMGNSLMGLVGAFVACEG